MARESPPWLGKCSTSFSSWPSPKVLNPFGSTSDLVFFVRSDYGSGQIPKALWVECSVDRTGQFWTKGLKERGVWDCIVLTCCAWRVNGTHELIWSELWFDSQDPSSRIDHWQRPDGTCMSLVKMGKQHQKEQRYSSVYFMRKYPNLSILDVPHYTKYSFEKCETGLVAETFYQCTQLILVPSQENWGSQLLSHDSPRTSPHPFQCLESLCRGGGRNRGLRTKTQIRNF